MRPFILDETVSKTDKSVMTFLIVLAVILLILFAFIGWLVRKTMHYQAQRANRYMTLVTKAGQIKNSREYFRYGMKLNRRLLFKQSLHPLIVILVGVLTWVISRWAQNNWNQNIFTDFADLFFWWDFGNPNNYTYVFGLRILAKFPDLIHTPTFVLEHLPSYVAVIGIVGGSIYYLVICQAFLSRSLVLWTESKKVLGQSVEDLETMSEEAKDDQLINTRFD